MKRRERVYVSFPYRNDPDKNKKIITMLINELYKKFPQYFFVSPLHSVWYFGDIEAEEMHYDDDIIIFDLEQENLCDKVWIFDYTEKSVGCDYERLEGMRADKTVRVWDKHEIENFLGVDIDDIA